MEAFISEGYKKTTLGIIPNDWSIVKLRDIATKCNKKNIDESITTVFSNSAVNGIVLQNEYFDKDIAQKGNLSGYYIVEHGDFVYNPRISQSAPAGPINRNLHSETGVVSPLYTVFREKSNGSTEFFEHFFRSTKWLRYMMSVANYGARHDRMNVTNDDFFDMPIPYPEKKERDKIAQVLTTWDEVISKQEKLIKGKEQLKKGLMQKLLSGEVRFDDFNDEWEEVKFHEVFERITRKNTINNQNVLTISAQYGLVSQEDFFNKSVSSNDLSGYILLKKDEFAYNKSYSKGYPMGAIKRLKKYEQGVVSSLYIYFKVKRDDPEFYEHYFEAGLLNREIYKIAQEGARNHGLLNMSVIEFFKDLNIKRPSKVEQKKIAQVLTNADNEIDLLKKELEELKQQKKGLMQKLLTGEVRVKV